MLYPLSYEGAWGTERYPTREHGRSAGETARQHRCSTVGAPDVLEGRSRARTDQGQRPGPPRFPGRVASAIGGAGAHLRRVRAAVEALVGVSVEGTQVPAPPVSGHAELELVAGRLVRARRVRPGRRGNGRAAGQLGLPGVRRERAARTAEALDAGDRPTRGGPGVRHGPGTAAASPSGPGAGPCRGTLVPPVGAVAARGGRQGGRRPADLVRRGRPHGTSPHPTVNDRRTSNGRGPSELSPSDSSGTQTEAV